MEGREGEALVPASEKDRESEAAADESTGGSTGLSPERQLTFATVHTESRETCLGHE